MLALDARFDKSQRDVILRNIAPEWIVLLGVSTNHCFSAGKDISRTDTKGLIPVQYVFGEPGSIVAVVCHRPGHNLQPSILNQRNLLRHQPKGNIQQFRGFNFCTGRKSPSHICNILWTIGV